MGKIILELNESITPSDKTYARALVESALEINRDKKLRGIIGKMLYIMLVGCPPLQTDKISLKCSFYVAINVAFKTDDVAERLHRFMLIWNADEPDDEKTYVNFTMFEECEKVLRRKLDAFEAFDKAMNEHDEEERGGSEGASSPLLSSILRCLKNVRKYCEKVLRRKLDACEAFDKAMNEHDEEERGGEEAPSDFEKS